MKPTIYIGIDPGSTTGVAIWYKNTKKLDIMQFNGHCKAIMFLWQLFRDNHPMHYKLRIEDARLVKGNAYFASKNGNSKDQKVGYVKAFSKDWEIFCKENKLDYEMLPPKKNPYKEDPELFEKHTGIKTLKTHSHSRDAAFLVWGA